MKKRTEELLEILNKSPNIQDYYDNESENIITMTLPEYLKELCKVKGISKAECIRKSQLPRTYGYQIFSGLKKPTRNKVLCLCFGFCLTVEESQSLLKAAGYPILYARNKRDAVILFALLRSLSVMEVNDMLYELKYALLTSEH